MHRAAMFRVGVLGVLALALSSCGGGASQNTNSGPNPTPQPVTFQLTVSSTPGGTITSNPPGINCGSSCTATFDNGTKVTLSATPSTGNSFANWSGSCSGSSPTCTLTITNAVSVSANFSTGQVQLSVTATGSGSGTIVSSPPGISCQTCTANFASGTSVTLTANPTSGSEFAGWSGACSGSGNTCTVALNATASATAQFNATLQSIKHIIFMAQENRGFLHYFGALPRYWADSNGQYEIVQFDGLPQFNATQGPLPFNPGCSVASPPPGSCIYDPTVQVFSYHAVNKCTSAISPYWTPSHTDRNFKNPTAEDTSQNPQIGDQPMDGYVVNGANQARHGGYADVNGQRVMSYYTGDDLNYYYFMASNFGTSDRWFSPVMTNTKANRMYLLAATSAGHVATTFPAGTPLFANETIFQDLQQAGHTWRVYVTNPDPSLIQGSAMAEFSFTYQGTNPSNFVPVEQFAADAQAGNLPDVALIEPGYNDGTDEHPFENPLKPGGSVERGAAVVASHINALMNSPSWKDSVFILTWDEAGGFYDDMPPQPAVPPDAIPPLDFSISDVCINDTSTPICHFGYTGFRIPLIVVSPFTKRHYVSHTVADSTAILKFIETRFDLPNLTARDAAQQTDMTEFFDFVNAPWSTPPDNVPTQVIQPPCFDGVP